MEDNLDEKALYLNVNTKRTMLRKHLNISDYSIFLSKAYLSKEIDDRDGVELWWKESEIYKKTKFKSMGLSINNCS